MNGEVVFSCIDIAGFDARMREVGEQISTLLGADDGIIPLIWTGDT